MCLACLENSRKAIWLNLSEQIEGQWVMGAEEKGEGLSGQGKDSAFYSEELGGTRGF